MIFKEDTPEPKPPPPPPPTTTTNKSPGEAWGSFVVIERGTSREV